MSENSSKAFECDVCEVSLILLVPSTQSSKESGVAICAPDVDEKQFLNPTNLRSYTICFYICVLYFQAKAEEESGTGDIIKAATANVLVA